MTREMFFKILITAIVLGAIIVYDRRSLKKEIKKLKDDVSNLKVLDSISKITNGTPVKVKT